MSSLEYVASSDRIVSEYLIDVGVERIFRALFGECLPGLADKPTTIRGC